MVAAPRYGAGVNRFIPRDQPLTRIGRCIAGLALFGTGVAFLIASDLGAAPWDVFHTGISERTGIPVGTVIILVGAALLVLWIPLREQPGLGTILNAVEIGLVAGLVLDQIPELENLVGRVALMVGGVVLIAVGSGFYIGAGLGPGPRDGLMTGLVRRGISLHLARTGIEISVLVIGVLLGGSVGIGTALFAVAIGPLVHVLLPALTVKPRPELASA